MSAALTRARAREQRNSLEEQEVRGNVKTLPNHEAEPYSRPGSGMTPLMRAACDGQVETAQLLLDSGASVDARRRDGFTALTLAAFFGHCGVVQLLLEHGADVDARTRFDTSAEMWAASGAFFKTSDLLREARMSKAREHLPLTLVQQEDVHSTPSEEEGDPKDLQLEVPIDEVGETTLKTTMESAPLVAEIDHNREKLDPVVGANPGQASNNDAPRAKPKAIQLLPDIVDLPPITPPEFHPGSVFLSRITASAKTFAALGLGVLIVFGFAIFIIFRILTSGTREPVTITTELPRASGDSLAKPQEKTSEEIGGSTPSVVEPVEPATTSGTSELNSAEQIGADSTPKAEPANVQEKTSLETGTFRNGNSYSFSNRRSWVAPTVFRSSFSNRKPKPVSASATVTQPKVPAEETKPAPLITETTRSRTTSAEPERPSENLGQSAPLGVTSGKPKSKVIQWP